MLIAAIICLGLTVISGFWAGAYVLGQRLPPWRLAIGHGLAAALGLLAVFALLDSGRLTPGWPLFLLLGTLVAGIGLFSLHLRARPLPLALVLLHALLALCGLAGLLLALY
ncbi:MAG: hypothetical protein ACAI44_02665 [Candidatus Sericytochromatia bacterium]